MTTASLPERPQIAGCDFRLTPLVGGNALRGAGHLGNAFGDFLWYASIQTTPLGRAAGGAYKWLLADRRGAQRALFLYDASRPRPLEYLTEAWGDAPTADSTEITADCTWLLADLEGEGVVPPWGFPQIAAFDADAGTIDLEGFRPGAVISEGDYGHCDDDDVRRLFITASGTADSAGELAGLEVRPLPALTSALPIPFTMEKASAKMLIVSGRVGFRAPIEQNAAIEAVQTLNEDV